MIPHERYTIDFTIATKTGTTDPPISLDGAVDRGLFSPDDLLRVSGKATPMPTSHPFQLLETVALVSDVPELGLLAGEVGAIVEMLSDAAFEVEFCDESGFTYGLHTFRAHQMVRLHTRGHALRTRLEAA